MKKILPSIFLFLIWANSYTQATLSWSRNFEVNLNNYYDEAPKIETDNQTIKHNQWSKIRNCKIQLGWRCRQRHFFRK